MKKTLNRTLLFPVGAILLLLSIVYRPWIEYSGHLAFHQTKTILSRKKIETIYQEKLTSDEQSKIELIQKVKKFGKSLFELKRSKSFEYYVYLERQTLGWNLTAAYPLKLKAVEFSFPLIGTFSYLGFFNENLKNRWLQKFKQKGYDVYENEISAYSTLGYFQDPLFSTYLQFSQITLVRLILHEMSHEKLYFQDDSSFSESLSSYIEKIAARKYLQLHLKGEIPPLDQNIARKEMQSFLELLNTYKNKLNTLYKSSENDGEKHRQKQILYLELQKKLKKLSKELRYVEIPPELYEIPLNNAALVQFGRYQPQEKSFQNILDFCYGEIPCWFSLIEKMKKCPSEVRKTFLESSMNWNDVKKACDIQD